MLRSTYMSPITVNFEGLTELLTKLVEVISSGIGAVSKPLLIRLTAGARAYEIKKIAGAISETQGLPVTVEYKEEGITVVQKELPESPWWLEKRPVAQRAFTRPTVLVSP